MSGEPKPHPALVNPEKTDCSNCHAELMSNPVVHAAAKDGCLQCHEFSKEEKKTLVAPVAVGIELCTMCHSELADAAAGKIAAPHYPVTDSCTGCHNPHSTKEPKLVISPLPALCLTCHDAATIDPAHGKSVSRGDCRSCHLPHGGPNAKLLRAANLHPPFADKTCQSCHKRGGVGRGDKGSAKVCYACHTEQQEAFGKGVIHTVVKQGKCEGCHDPHLSDQPKFLLKPKQELCVSCHAEISAKVASASSHPPAKDDCGQCHEAHRSDNPFQLTDTKQALCTMCHDAGDAELRNKHLGADLSKLDCTSCHDPHGSTERSLIVAEAIHPPFAERTCDLCHDGMNVTLQEGGSKDVCLACHGEIGEMITNSPVKHAAMDAADCSDCHTPHASRQSKLIREPAGGECFSCHDDKRAAAGEFQHGAITLLGCQSCHEPHGGARAKLISADNIDQLCLSCHDKARTNVKVQTGQSQSGAKPASLIQERTDPRTIELVDGAFNHPIQNHRALGMVTDQEIKLVRKGVNFRGELHCLTCHDPHKGRMQKLFANGAIEPCGACHTK